MMEETSIDTRVGEDVESPRGLHKQRRLTEYRISEITTTELNQFLEVQVEMELPSDSKQQLVGKRCIEGLSLQGAQARIPKYIRFASLNENTLDYCLDLLKFRATNSSSIVCSPAVPRNISVNLVCSKKASLTRGHIRRNTSDLGAFVIKCPSSTRGGRWIVSTIGRHQIPRDTLNDPLLHFVAFDGIMNIAGVGLIDVKETKDTKFIKFPSRLGIRAAKKLETEKTVVANQKHGIKSINKPLVPSSNAKYNGSDQSSASSSAASSQGVLHCRWEAGVPYFTYSVDGQREVYVAKMLKVKSSDDTDLDFMYLFYSKKGGRKAHGTCEDSLGDLVGKMKVSSSLTLCSDLHNAKHMETEFVLFSVDAKHIGKTATSDPKLGKQVYPNKVVDIFRPKHLLKHRSSFKSGAQNSIPESCSLGPCEDNKLNKPGSEKFLESLPNSELVAIVFKEQVLDKHQNAVGGGWGLKFLEKVQVERANTTQEPSVSSDGFRESCPTQKRYCSSTLNVILPAGFHGGPKTRNGGPSGLIERWRSGGHCDCGGWDIGCPLTVLNSQSSEEVPTNATAKGNSKSVNLVIEGSTEQRVPSVKLVNILDDKYHIQFQSSLSALQSFSIGVGIIHTQSHSLYGSKEEYNIKKELKGSKSEES